MTLLMLEQVMLLLLRSCCVVLLCWLILVRWMIRLLQKEAFLHHVCLKPQTIKKTQQSTKRNKHCSASDLKRHKRRSNKYLIKTQRRPSPYIGYYLMTKQQRKVWERNQISSKKKTKESRLKKKKRKKKEKKQKRLC